MLYFTVNNPHYLYNPDYELDSLDQLESPVEVVGGFFFFFFQR